MPRNENLLRFTSLTVALCLSASASASDCDAHPQLSSCIDSDPLVPALGGRLVTMPTETPVDAGVLRMSLFSTYLSQPVNAQVASADPDGTTIHVIDNAINVTAALAYSLTSRFGVHAALPYTVFQDGAGVSDIIGSDDSIETHTLRNPRFGVEYSLTKEATHRRALLAQLSFSLPFGSKESFASNSSLVASPALSGFYGLGRATLAGRAGLRLRQAVQFADVTVGSQAELGVGVAYEVLPALVLASLESYGLLGIPPNQEGTLWMASPFEWIASVMTTPFADKKAEIRAGFGTSLPVSDRAELTANRFRIHLGLSYALSTSP